MGSERGRPRPVPRPRGDAQPSTVSSGIGGRRVVGGGSGLPSRAAGVLVLTGLGFVPCSPCVYGDARRMPVLYSTNRV